MQADEKAFRSAHMQESNIRLERFQGKLITKEPFWVALQPFLLSRGYQLRPRYQPDWIPSWRNQDVPVTNLYVFEDALTITRGNLLDAVRVRDQIKVVLKCVRTSTEEIPIARYLSSPSLMSDPRNRTVPILDVIPLPNDDTEALIVMPLLLHFNALPFRRVSEFAEAISQYLQGLEFMHEHNIAHRDACYFNLMMDGSKVIPKGFHFFKPSTHDGVTYGLDWRERGSVKPNEYYFIDFGLSTRYPAEMRDITDTGILGQDSSVPEASVTVPYDPFKVDVYQLGNVILQLIEEYEGLEPFRELGQAMTRLNPDERPSPSDALKEIKKLSWWTLRHRIWERGIHIVFRFLIKFCGAKFR